MARSDDISRCHPLRRLENDELLRTRHRLLGEKLRREYQDITAEPLPAEFLELLERVDQRARLKR